MLTVLGPHSIGGPQPWGPKPAQREAETLSLPGTTTLPGTRGLSPSPGLGLTVLCPRENREGSLSPCAASMHYQSPTPGTGLPLGLASTGALAEQGWVGSGDSSQDKKEASARADFKNIIKDAVSDLVHTSPESFLFSKPTAPIPWLCLSSLGSDGLWALGSLRPDQGPWEGLTHPSQAPAVASSGHCLPVPSSCRSSIPCIFPLQAAYPRKGDGGRVLPSPLPSSWSLSFPSTSFPLCLPAPSPQKKTGDLWVQGRACTSHG